MGASVPCSDRCYCEDTDCEPVKFVEVERRSAFSQLNVFVNPLPVLNVEEGPWNTLGEGGSPPRPECLASTGPGNRNVRPEYWALSLSQWVLFLDECMDTFTWADLIARKGYANSHDVSEHFVKPWTRRTGSSVSLLMNADQPLQAKVMVSHSWAGDVAQSKAALLAWTRANDLPSDLELWFCLFSAYQPESAAGDGGPEASGRLGVDVVGQVIQCVQAELGLVAVHTTRDNPYGRLWCVFEIGKALEANAKTFGITSTESVNSSTELSSLRVDTSKAFCSLKDDEAMLRAIIEANGGYRRLDGAVLQFRLDAALAQALGQGDAARCGRLLAARADAGRQDVWGRTCLHRAALAGRAALVGLLLEREADPRARDADGNTPAHLVPLVPQGDFSLSLFKALASPYDVAASRNRFGISPFVRFEIWARTGMNAFPNRAALEYADQLAEKWPGLPREPMLHMRRSLAPPPGLVQHSSEDQSLRGRRVRVYRWAGPHADCADVLALSFLVPWAAARGAFDCLAQRLCIQCRANLQVLTYTALGTLTEDTEFEDFIQEVCDVIEALPLRRPLFIIEDSDGLLAPVYWELQAELAGILLINPCHFYGEDIFGTDEHAAQSRAYRQVASSCYAHDKAVYLSLVRSMVHGSCSVDKEVAKDQLETALMDVEPVWWLLLGKYYSWIFTMSEALQGLPPLRSTPAALLCSGQAPEPAQASCQRLRRRLLPHAAVDVVQHSRAWWKLEGMQQVESMAKAIASFILDNFPDRD